MTLFARLLGWTQVFDGCGNWPWVLVGGHRIDLVGAGELGTHVPFRAFANVTFRAGNAGMWRMLVGDQLGLHDGVTGLAAERHRFRKMISVVTGKSCHQQERKACRDE